MKLAITKNEKRIVRHRRIRARLAGTSERPRLAIYRSNRSVYAQLIDDSKGHTLASIDAAKAATGKKLMEKVVAAGAEMAAKITKLGIKKVVFDRGGYIYTGKVKAFADAVRAAGIVF